MANEAVILELYGQPTGEPMRYTIADEVAIEKGTILKLSGADLTAAKSETDGDIFAGFAATEKVANDGQVTIGAFSKGLFDLAATGTVAIGDRLKISGANIVAVADDDIAEHASQHFGTALEAAAAGSGTEVIRVWVH